MSSPASDEATAVLARMADGLVSMMRAPDVDEAAHTSNKATVMPFTVRHYIDVGIQTGSPAEGLDSSTMKRATGRDLASFFARRVD